MAEPIPQSSDEHQDIRPRVARRSSNRSVWLFAAILLAVAGGTIYAMQLRRLTLASPSSVTALQVPGNGFIAAPPELPIAPDRPNSNYPIFVRAPDEQRAPSSLVTSPPVTARARAIPSRDDTMPGAPSSLPLPLPTASSFGLYSTVQGPGPGVTFQPPTNPSVPQAAVGKQSDTRAQATRIANPSTTVPQGTVIQVVLETALDSTRPGYARAIVSRDVTSFDGTRVLIPKGSRLFGEYAADLNLGQNRALIEWHRLTRPDGSLIDVDSPSADPLGRAGVKGKVNSHFFERFGGAILQSILDIGVQVASRKASGDTVFVALPNSTQAIVPQQPANVRPTLKIRQGASVSVFVARDLDFTAVEP